MEAVSFTVILEGVSIVVLSAAVLGVARLWARFEVALAQRELLVRQNDAEHTALREGQARIQGTLDDVAMEIRGLRKDLTKMEIHTAARDGGV